MNYLVCIGSNAGQARNMELARRELKVLFPEVAFSAEIMTQPIGMKRSDPFANQLARFSAPISPAEVEQLLKQIERKSGRSREEKALEVVRLDLDLLMAGSRPLRSDDLQRSFVRQLMVDFWPFG